MTLEPGVRIYILAEVASTTHIRCRDEDVEDDGIRDCKVGSIASWEKSMWLRAIHRSRERSYLVALHDGCCDNDDGLVATHRSHVLGNIHIVGAFWQS